MKEGKYVLVVSLEHLALEHLLDSIFELAILLQVVGGR